MRVMTMQLHFIKEVENEKILVTIPVREKDRKFLEEKGKEFQFCYRTKEEITVSDVVDAEIILGNIPVELVPEAKKLKFLQLDSAGSTEYTASGVLMPDTKLANATGAYGLAISEYMLAGVLMLRKSCICIRKYGAASVEGRGRSAVNP